MHRGKNCSNIRERTKNYHHRIEIELEKFLDSNRDLNQTLHSTKTVLIFYPDT